MLPIGIGHMFPSSQFFCHLKLKSKLLDFKNLTFNLFLLENTSKIL
jgi:hypothetical protein